MAVLEEFTWILALGVIFSFTMAFGIGANDVAVSLESFASISVFRSNLN